MPRTVTVEQLNEFLGFAQQVVDAQYAVFSKSFMHSRQGPALEFDNITGRNKYARIWSVDKSGSRSSWAFIGLEDGNVWKCDGWKKPALNFPRGNIFDNDHGLVCASWTGVS